MSLRLFYFLLLYYYFFYKSKFFTHLFSPTPYSNRVYYSFFNYNSYKSIKHPPLSPSKPILKIFKNGRHLLHYTINERKAILYFYMRLINIKNLKLLRNRFFFNRRQVQRLVRLKALSNRSLSKFPELVSKILRLNYDFFALQRFIKVYIYHFFSRRKRINLILPHLFRVRSFFSLFFHHALLNKFRSNITLPKRLRVIRGGPKKLRIRVLPYRRRGLKFFSRIKVRRWRFFRYLYNFKLRKLEKLNRLNYRYIYFPRTTLFFKNQLFFKHFIRLNRLVFNRLNKKKIGYNKLNLHLLLTKPLVQKHLKHRYSLSFKKKRSNFYFTLTDLFGEVVIHKSSGSLLKKTIKKRNRKLRNSFFNLYTLLELLIKALKRKRISKIHIFEKTSSLHFYQVQKIIKRLKLSNITVQELRILNKFSHGIPKKTKKVRRL